MYRPENSSVWKSIDWLTVALYLLLALAGCLSIYGASYNFDNTNFLSFDQSSGRQLVWLGTSVFIAICIMLVDANNFFSWSLLIYAFSIGMLLLTIVMGTDVKGSHSWLVLGPVRIQPAEFAKFSVSLLLARFMSSYSFNIRSAKGFMGVAAIILLPIGLIILQNETGSALVFFSLMLMLYREGMPGILLFLAVCLASFFVVGLKYGETLVWGQTVLGQFAVLALVLVVVCAMLLIYRRDEQTTRILFLINIPAILIGILINVFGWWSFNLCYLQLILLLATVLYLAFKALQFRLNTYLMIASFALFSAAFLYSTDYAFNKVLEPHQQIRIKVLLGMEDDPSGAGYNVNQSKIAIGSGGFFGKGFLNGTQTKLKYVPEQDTDFIFCTVGEEEGFLGSVLLLGVFVALLMRLITLAERQRSSFSRIYGYCVVSILFFHVFVNVGMVLGLLPVIGIPLPFISYGGSSLWGFTIMLFVFLRMDAGHA